MKRTTTQPDDIKRALDLIQRTGAMKHDEVAAAFGWGRDYCRQVLGACPGIKTMRVLRLTHYMTTAECASRKVEAERKKKARWMANKIKARAAATDKYESAPDCGGWLPKQIFVPAASAVPVRTTAARSVFEWRPA